MEYNSERSELQAGMFFDMGSLYDSLQGLSDKRKARGKRYGMGLILGLIVLAKLSNHDKLTAIAEWIEHRTEELKAAFGVTSQRLPSYSTLRRVLGETVQAEEFELAISQFFAGLPRVGQSEVILIDGKELRGTIETGQTHGRHLLAAYLPSEGIILMQVEVASKHNEITAMPILLKRLVLLDKIVVADAMFTQHTIAAEIVDGGGDYVFPVKDNQPTLRQDIEDVFVPVAPIPAHAPAATDFQTYGNTCRAHGRIEQRTLTTSCMLNDYVNWPGLKQVFKIERQFTYCKTGRVALDIQYGVTSLSRAKATPRRLLELVRGYWAIENSVHYRRDVTFGEDASRLNVGDAPRLIAAINNLVLGLLGRLHFENIAKARRSFDARPQTALPFIFRRQT